MRRALLSILCAVALAGCGGEKKAETESEAPSREAQAACTGSALAAAPKLPPSFPQIEAEKLTYTKQETVGPTVVVEGYFHGDVEEAHEEFQKELKGAGFPPLAWYDALLELDRAPDGRLRPFELERHMLLPQYSTSRLVDRLERAGLVERLQCPADGRGLHVSITAAGRELRRRMWPAYAAAIERHLGSKIGCTDAQTLAALLGRLSAAGCERALCGTAEAESQVTD